jgi:hypothetical protein
MLQHKDIQFWLRDTEILLTMVYQPLIAKPYQEEVIKLKITSPN